MQTRASRQDEWGKKRPNSSVRHIQGWAQWYGAFIRKANMDSVDSPLRCARSLPTKQIKNKNKHEDIIPETKKEKQSRVERGRESTMMKNMKTTNIQNFSLRLSSLWRKQLLPYSLSPTKYSQTCVKFRIYCCFTAFSKPETIVSRRFTFVSSVLNLVQLPCCTHQPPKIPLCQFFFLRDQKQCSQKKKQLKTDKNKEKKKLFWQSKSLFLHCFCLQCKD